MGELEVEGEGQFRRKAELDTEAERRCPQGEAQDVPNQPFSKGSFPFHPNLISAPQAHPLKELFMKYQGTALCVGDHIDTDAIIPARLLVTTDTATLGKGCMAGLDPDWIKKVTPGKNVLVAGKNFGCGSSREHAPIAIAGAGIPVVLAKSFARIFYRNAFNMGLLPLEIGEDMVINEGDEVLVDMEAGEVTNKTTGQKVKLPPLPAAMQGLLDAGGLVNYVRRRLNK